MKTKKEAKKLIKKFKRVVNILDEKYLIYDQLAIDCAITCVNEIMKTYPGNDAQFHYWASVNECLMQKSKKYANKIS